MFTDLRTFRVELLGLVAHRRAQASNCGTLQVEAPIAKRVETAIAAALEQHRPQLEQLVHDRIQTLGAELVADELEGRTNDGQAASNRPRVAEEPSSAKTCLGCGETKAPAQLLPLAGPRS